MAKNRKRCNFRNLSLNQIPWGSLEYVLHLTFKMQFCSPEGSSFSHLSNSQGTKAFIFSPPFPSQQAASGCPVGTKTLRHAMLSGWWRGSSSLRSIIRTSSQIPAFSIRAHRKWRMRQNFGKGTWEGIWVEDEWYLGNARLGIFSTIIYLWFGIICLFELSMSFLWYPPLYSRNFFLSFLILFLQRKVFWWKKQWQQKSPLWFSLPFYDYKDNILKVLFKTTLFLLSQLLGART